MRRKKPVEPDTRLECEILRDTIIDHTRPETLDEFGEIATTGKERHYADGFHLVACAISEAEAKERAARFEPYRALEHPDGGWDVIETQHRGPTHGRWKHVQTKQGGYGWSDLTAAPIVGQPLPLFARGPMLDLGAALSEQLGLYLTWAHSCDCFSEITTSVGHIKLGVGLRSYWCTTDARGWRVDLEASYGHVKASRTTAFGAPLASMLATLIEALGDRLARERREAEGALLDATRRRDGAVGASADLDALRRSLALSV